MNEGTVYLIHLDRPFHHARHYLGWTCDLSHRLVQHRMGTGAKLLRAVTQHGIGWSVVRTWQGGPDLEKAFKTQKNGPRLCPYCQQKRLVKRWGIRPLPLSSPAGLWSEEEAASCQR